MSTRKYSVAIHFGGCMNYEIEAKSRQEAIEIADELFENENAINIVNELCDFDTDCWPKEEDER